jgi:hypothetical protein
LEKPESGNDTFNLVMSPVEWREIHALAKFGQAAAAYDCTAPYVFQVIKYDASQPEEILADREMQAALAALDRMAARISPDGGGRGNVTFALPKEDYAAIPGHSQHGGSGGETGCSGSRLGV